MRGFALKAIGAALCSLLAVSAAQAQSPSGPWFGIGGGLGWATADWLGPSATMTGGSGYIRGGWALSDHVRIGGEVDLWRRPVDNEQPESAYRLFDIAGVVSYHARSGAFVRGGLTMGVVAGDVDLYKGATLSASKGPGAIVGIGFESPVSTHVAGTFGVNVRWANIGELRSGQTILRTGWSQRVIDATIGLTFR